MTDMENQRWAQLMREVRDLHELVRAVQKVQVEMFDEITAQIGAMDLRNEGEDDFHEGY